MYETSETSQDAFMKQFKFYKQIKSLHDLQNTDCLFLDNLEKNQNFNVFNLFTENISDQELENVGMKNSKFLSCFELKSNPGLLVIPNPFVNFYQRYLVQQCLNKYHNLPNKTNLDLHTKREGNLWHEAISEFNKLRWATIGYHYDWTNKVYNQLDYTYPPEELTNLSRAVACLIGCQNFKPEAGIINYYHLNSTLSAHQDHSEKNMTAEESKNEKPAALLLRSGDVVIMSSQSRLAFHAVPKILSDPNVHRYFEIEHDSSENHSEWTNYYDYIKTNRININIRQVNE